MKKLSLFIFGIIILCVQNVLAQKNDEDLIKKTLLYYLDGGTQNDFNLVKKAFHETASMKFISKEGYKEVNARDFFKKAIKPGPKQSRKTSIKSIDIEGNAAVAKLEIVYENFMFIDFMSLLKIDGQWLIVSKIFYRKSE